MTKLKILNQEFIRKNRKEYMNISKKILFDFSHFILRANKYLNENNHSMTNEMLDCIVAAYFVDNKQSIFKFPKMFLAHTSESQRLCVTWKRY